MRDDVRRAAVALLDVANEAPDGDIPFPLRGPLWNLKDALLADKAERDRLAAVLQTARGGQPISLPDAAVELDGTPGAMVPPTAPPLHVPSDTLADSPEGRAVARHSLRRSLAHAYLMTRADGLLSSAVRQAGSLVEVKLPADAKHFCDASLELAELFLSRADAFARLRVRRTVSVNGGPHAEDSVRLAEMDDAA